MGAEDGDCGGRRAGVKATEIRTRRGLYRRFPFRHSLRLVGFHFGPPGCATTTFCTGCQPNPAGLALASIKLGCAAIVRSLLQRLSGSISGSMPPSMPRSKPRSLTFALFLLAPACLAPAAFAQGGPPYYTNDPGTPGPFNWEINIGYMPFFYSNQSVSHTPDVDINFGIGERIQLTYENAWLRVQNPASPVGSKAQFGLGQSNPGVKWRFYDAGEKGLSISVFPQLFLNNPNDAVRRGITSPSQSFLLPFEFSRKFGPIDVDYEIGYEFVHKGSDGFITGLVIGHEFTPKFEADAEFYYQGTFHPFEHQPTIDFGARYKIHSPIILLLMAGRSLEPTGSNQPYFVGYFGLQF